MNNPPPIDNRFVELGCEQFSSKPPASTADELTALRTRLQQVESERDSAIKEVERLRLLLPTTAQAMVYENLLMKFEQAEAEAAVMRGAVELVVDAYSFVSGGSREPISTAMKRPENEMRVFRLVVSLNNLRKKCESTHAGKSLLERLKEAEGLLSRAHPGMHTCETSQWFTDRDLFLGLKPCPTCGGERGLDSGGVTPWGAGIAIPCPTCNPKPQDVK